MNTKEELKPCPFCGCEATIDEISSYDELRDFDYTVECSDPVCMARECGNARFGAKEFAIEAWNRRHVDAAQSAEIKRLKAVLMTIRLDALDKRSRHEGLNTNETLHTINNALKPQESEATHE